MAESEPKKSGAALAKPTGLERPLSEISATIRKAEGGNKEALAEVREMLTRPGIPDILGGNVAKEALNRLVKARAGENPVIQEATLRKLEEMRAELSGPNPSALEKLLIDRVLATWLHLHHLELIYASKESLALNVGLYYQKAITAAQKRHVGAIRGLADVRKLALPVLQVNIAKKQVNVAAGAVAC